ncbi:tRNA threonylcarbamoyladenosine biosynthesis protein TsaB [bacterium BMS3Abin04]|nr:tRNA threonylcarbamoyladenosine biosynthesis protein TsaB [bacterium BMS3Abin04]
MLPLLAIETSGELCSVAVMFNENNFAETNIKQKNIHSEKLMDMVNYTLETATLKINDLNAVAVSTGPGSFTGLRIGMSAAKGIAFGADLQIVPVPTFNALAYEISNFLKAGTSFVVSNIVNTTEIYFSKYLKSVDGLQTISELRVIKKEELQNYIEDKDLVYGNFTNINNDFSLASPSAKFVAKWAYIFGKDLLTFNFDYMEPNYLKNFVPRIKK